MARLDVWFRTYVLSLIKSPSRRSKRTHHITISAPMNVEHHNPIPYLQHSISAQHLPTPPSPPATPIHARHNSDDATTIIRRPLTIHIREPSTATLPATSLPATSLPATSFPSELPERELTLSSPDSSSKRMSKRFSQLSTTARDVVSSHSETPRPVSYFAPGYDVSIADLMPINDDIKETTSREAKRMSHISVITKMEADERRKSKRMSSGFDLYAKPAKSYVQL